MTDNVRDSALRQAAACARETYAGEEEGIERGLLLALNDKVEIGPDEAFVQSDRDPEVVYTVKGLACECPDNRNAPDGRCKHVLSVHLTIITRLAMRAV